MAGSSQRNFLITAFAALLLAALVFAGIRLYHDAAGFLEMPGAPTSPAPREEDAPSTPRYGPLPVTREDARPGVPPWPDISRSQPLANGSRPLAAPVPPPGVTPDKERTGRPDETAPDALAAARRDEPARETAPAPDVEGDAESAPDQAAQDQATPEQTARDRTGGSARETPAEQTPLIVYGTGKTARDTGGNVVRGDIPARQTPPDTTELYGSPASSPRERATRRVSPKGEDSVVGLAVIQDLAKFLADNHWPAGTHPRARRRGISTATVRWANAKFGARPRDFSASPDAARERARILNYVFMPSMIRGLYDLYSERFLTALEREALSQRRGPEKRPFTRAEIAEMYGLYASLARGLAGTVRAYADTPGARALSRAYLDAGQRAEEANRHLLAAMQTGSPGGASLTKQYQAAVLQREQRREALISALRQGGPPHSLDSDNVLYTAMWLYRRGSGAQAAMRALADILDKCAASLEEKQRRSKTDQNMPQARIND